MEFLELEGVSDLFWLQGVVLGFLLEVQGVYSFAFERVWCLYVSGA